MKQLFISLLILVTASISFAQVSGTVTDADTGEALIAATVRVSGTNTGTVTDIDGKYSVDAEQGQTLVVSYIGYLAQEVPVTGNSIDVQLAQDVNSLEEVVAIGFGEMQSKDLTSAISTVTGEVLSETPSGNVLQGLQGKVPGVQVVSVGQPGSQPQIRIRGTGSYYSANASPLYVVDGMYYDNIDFLNQSDIENMSILRDASSLAIYGNRGANGVIIITTKTGYKGQATNVTFDSYYGSQVPTNVLKMANAEQFVQMVSELNPATSPDYQFVLNAMQRYGRSRVNPNVPDVNTDWYKEIMSPAPIQNYNLNVAGGGEKAGYSLGGSIFNQEGILDMNNDYKRYNVRAKLDFDAYEWLTLGANAVFSNAVKHSPENTAWRTAYYAVPILPVYDYQNTAATPNSFANAKDLGYRGSQNPFVAMTYNDNRENLRKLLGAFYADVKIIPDKLNFKSTYNQSYTSLDLRNINYPYDLGNGTLNDNSDISRNWSNFDNRIWNNQLDYMQEFDEHDLHLMAGTSFEKYSSQYLRASASGFDINQSQSWYIDQSTEFTEDSYGDGGDLNNQMSYFGRLNYEYDDKYIFYGTARYDGTSKFQETWIFSPSVGLGWVMSEEDFFKSKTIDFFKLRGGWGKVPNANISTSVGSSVLSFGDTVFDDQRVTGYVPQVAVDSIGWEYVQELNFGVSLNAFRGKLNTEMDYFNRKTKDAVIPLLVPFVGGTIRRNAGEISNRGFEFSADWADSFQKDWNYNISANFSTLRNEVLDLFGQEYLDAGSAEFRQRSIVGEPLFAFYGWQTDGVYQNQAEIDADPIAVANGLVPGDYRFKDLNGDGELTGEDRSVLGSYFPKLTYGFNLGLDYKDFSLQSNFYGISGNEILNRKRGEYIFTNDTNIDAELANNLWRGDGSSNKYPSADGLRRGWNQRMSDYYIESGSFFRVQNVNMSYRIDRSRIMDGKFPTTIITATADRPITSFKYNGFNPEVGNGVDTQTYPVPAVYTVGLKLQF